jgi:hypothetical protein
MITREAMEPLLGVDMTNWRREGDVGVALLDLLVM